MSDHNGPGQAAGDCIWRGFAAAVLVLCAVAGGRCLGARSLNVPRPPVGALSAARSALAIHSELVYFGYFGDGFCRLGLYHYFTSRLCSIPRGMFHSAMNAHDPSRCAMLLVHSVFLKKKKKCELTHLYTDHGAMIKHEPTFKLLSSL